MSRRFAVPVAILTAVLLGLLLIKGLFFPVLRLGVLTINTGTNLSLLFLLFFSMLLYLFRGSGWCARDNWVIGIVLVVTMVTTLLSQGVGDVVVDGDGVGYFSFLHSFHFDGDVAVENQLQRLEPGRSHPLIRRTGMADNAFSIGPALLWYPSYVVADLIYRQAHPDRTGLEPFYLRAIKLTKLIYACLGLFLLFKSLRVLYPLYASLCAILVVIFASPLLFYLEYAHFYSHVYSLFGVALFVYSYLRIEGRQRSIDWAMLGVVAGVLCLIRWQNALFVGIPIVHALVRHWPISRREVAQMTGRFVLYAVVLFLTFSPQLMVFKAIYGSYLTVPQGSAFITFVPTWLIETVFSSYHGLLYWHPLLAVGIIGFCLQYRGREGASSLRLLYGLFALAFVSQIYLNSSISQYWAGASYGSRRFISSLVFLGFGLANFSQHISTNKWFDWVSVALINIFASLNYFMVRAFVVQSIPSQEPVAFTKIMSASWEVLASDLARDHKRLVLWLACLGVINYLIYVARDRDREPAAGTFGRVAAPTEVAPI